MTTKDDAWNAFRAADWAAARDAFAAALAESPGDPEALDGLGQSLWWLGEREAGIDRRREAYAAYRRRGDVRQAGGLAVYLAGEHRISGEAAAASGWLSRGRRLLEGLEPGPEHGWLAIEDAKRAGDPSEAERHARAALELARAIGDLDIECMALAHTGRALTAQGRVAEGVALLDEAMAAAMGGETSDPLATGDACCTTLVACERLSDVRRAAEWCAAVVDFTERRHFTPVQSWCRAVYGGVLLRAGDWARAEAVLEEALRRVGDRRRGGGHALPLALLATLRVRQGRLEEAERLLDGIDDDPAALAALVELHLARGDAQLAGALAERTGDDALLGAVALARGRTADAGRAAARLRERAEALGRDDLAAWAALLAGRAEDSEGALEEAVRRFGELGTPLEEARSRLALARLRATEASPLAAGTARAACAAFERLGARRDADAAAALLRSLGAAGRSAPRGERDELTAREREVLALIAAGLTNAQIAERLVIAPKTAEHHVGRVLAKLGVRSRAEAAAHAVREGLAQSANAPSAP